MGRTYKDLDSDSYKLRKRRPKDRKNSNKRTVREYLTDDDLDPLQRIKKNRGKDKRGR